MRICVYTILYIHKSMLERYDETRRLQPNELHVDCGANNVVRWEKMNEHKINKNHIIKKRMCASVWYDCVHSQCVCVRLLFCCCYIFLFVFFDYYFLFFFRSFFLYCFFFVRSVASTSHVYTYIFFLFVSLYVCSGQTISYNFIYMYWYTSDDHHHVKSIDGERIQIKMEGEQHNKKNNWLFGRMIFLIVSKPRCWWTQSKQMPNWRNTTITIDAETTELLRSIFSFLFFFFFFK